MQASDSYRELIAKARWSHEHGRSISHITQGDVNGARLFSYAYRSQSIGTFHAARVALEAEEKHTASSSAHSFLTRAQRVLKQLEDKVVDPVPQDAGALISTLFYYDQLVNLAAEILDDAGVRSSFARVEFIRQRLLDNLRSVRMSNGIYTASDCVLPEQGAFVVPNLGISIVPVIYGDHHSWNTAFLTRDQYGVPVHRHRKGVEIHLGFSPVKGVTILGGSCAEVDEGYAMPIRPMTDHGFENTSGHDHVVPFVFGSLQMGGWGAFLDVEPRPPEADFIKRPLRSGEMNHSVFLEQELHRLAAKAAGVREVIISCEQSGSAETGGLELAATNAGGSPIELSADYYRIISVRSGRARVRIGGAESEVAAHDHFGVPAAMSCSITSIGSEPLVFLDALILPLPGALHRNYLH